MMTSEITFIAPKAMTVFFATQILELVLVKIGISGGKRSCRSRNMSCSLLSVLNRQDQLRKIRTGDTVAGIRRFPVLVDRSAAEYHGQNIGK